MTQGSSGEQDDLTTTMFMIVGGVSTGLISVSALFSPIRAWMLQYYLLAQGEQVVIPFIDGVGFGWPQIVVIGGLLAMLIALAVWLKRRTRDRV